jgi:NACalpha-BTF3-like transcription factor
MKNVAVFAQVTDDQLTYFRSLIADNGIQANLVVGEVENFAPVQPTEALEERIKFLEGRIYQMRCVLDFKESEELEHATAMRLGEELLENPEMLQDEYDDDDEDYDTDEDDDENEDEEEMHPLVISMTMVFRISQIVGRSPMEILKVFRDYQIKDKQHLLREVQAGRFDQYLPSNYKERVIGLLGGNEETDEDDEEMILDFNEVNLSLISQATGYSMDQIKKKLIEENISSEGHLVKALIGGEFDNFLNQEVRTKVFEILEGY